MERIQLWDFLRSSFPEHELRSLDPLDSSPYDTRSWTGTILGRERSQRHSIAVKSHGHKELGCRHGRSEEASIQVPPQHASVARCGATAQAAVLLQVRDGSSVACDLPELWVLPRSADDSATG